MDLNGNQDELIKILSEYFVRQAIMHCLTTERIPITEFKLNEHLLKSAFFSEVFTLTQQIR